MTLLKLSRIVTVEGSGSTNGDIDWRGTGWTPRVSSGVTNWIQLTQADKALFFRINSGIDDHTLNEKIQYAAKEASGWPFHIVNGEWQQPSTTVCSKSMKDGEYNCVNSLGFSKGFHNIETIPVLDNYDHLSVEKQPWLFHRAWCTNRMDVTYDTPAGIIWLMLLNPIGRVHARGEITGFWLDNHYVDSVVGTPPPPEPRTISIPAGSRWYQRAGMTTKTGVFASGWVAPILEATTIKLISWYRVGTAQWVRGDFK